MKKIICVISEGVTFEYDSDGYKWEVEDNLLQIITLNKHPQEMAAIFKEWSSVYIVEVVEDGELKPSQKAAREMIDQLPKTENYCAMCNPGITKIMGAGLYCLKCQVITK